MSDPPASRPPPDEAEYREQVLERFAARTRSLTRQFLILMVFAFGFLIFIIVPLAALNFDAAHVDAQRAEIESLTERASDLEKSHAAKEQEVSFLQGNLTSLNGILERKREEAEARSGEIERLQAKLASNRAHRQEREAQARSLESAANGMKETLASFDTDQRVRDLRDWFSSTAFGGDRDVDCADDDREVYLRCLVKKKLEADWSRDFSLIDRNVVEPLRRIAPAVAGEIEGELSTVENTFRARLEANQDFWRSITGKELFMGGLSDDFNDAYEKIESIVQLRLEKIAEQSGRLETEIAKLTRTGQELETDLAGLNRELAEVEAETRDKARELDDEVAAIRSMEDAQEALAGQIAKLEQRLADLPDIGEIEAERAKIEARLASFESPFGAIPMGLKEAVLAYPLMLAAGFLICALLLSRVLALRREYRDSLLRESTLSEANVDRRVATLASLWFEPDRSIWANPALILALLVPFVLFVATGWLILNDWLLQLGDTDSAVKLRSFYAVLYALGLAVFLSGLYHLRKAWRGE